MDRFDSLRIFVRVAETGSFTKAADQLNLPRSTVSTAVQQLEARIGARLLHRTTRRVTLTQDGHAFHERCVRLLAELEETETLFQRAAQPQGTLRIDVPGRIGRLVVAPALPDFFGRYPGITLDLGATDRPINLVEAGVDCALRVGALEDSGLIARRLGVLTLVNCASPAYLARHGVPRTPDDLPHHLAVNYASPQTGKIDGWECGGTAARRTVAMPAQVTVNSAETYIACCLAGLGLIQIPAFDVRDHLQSGALVAVMPEWRAAGLPISLLYPHRQHPPQRLRVFIDWLTPLLQDRLELDAA